MRKKPNDWKLIQSNYMRLAMIKNALNNCVMLYDQNVATYKNDFEW